MSTDNRFFFVQIMIDSVNIYNAYKYDKDYDSLKVVISKFLSYPPLDVSTTPCVLDAEVGTTGVKINQGKTFMFPIAADRIKPVLGSSFVDFQVLLESSNNEKVKAGIHIFQLGYTRLQLKEDMKSIVDAVDTAKSDRPEIKEIEGAYVIRQGDLQVGTIFLGIRITMFGSSLSSSITSGSASVIDSSPPLIAERKVPNYVPHDQMRTESISKQDRNDQMSTESKYKQDPNDHMKTESESKRAPNDKSIPESTFKQIKNDQNVNSETISKEEFFSTIDKSSLLGPQSDKLPSNGQNNHTSLRRQKYFLEPDPQSPENMDVIKNQLKIMKKDNQNQPSQSKDQKPAGNLQIKNKLASFLYREPKDDLNKSYTYIYSELNGQVIDMKIVYEPESSTPEMGSKCV